MVHCPNCGNIMEIDIDEGVFGNVLLKPKRKGYKCPGCGHKVPKV